MTPNVSLTLMTSNRSCNWSRAEMEKGPQILRTPSSAVLRAFLRSPCWRYLSAHLQSAYRVQLRISEQPVAIFFSLDSVEIPSLDERRARELHSDSKSANRAESPLRGLPSHSWILARRMSHPSLLCTVVCILVCFHLSKIHRQRPSIAVTWSCIFSLFKLHSLNQRNHTYTQGIVRMHLQHSWRDMSLWISSIA